MFWREWYREPPLQTLALASIGLVLAWWLAFAPLPLLVLSGGGLLGVGLLLRWPWLIWPLLAASLPVASSIKQGPISLADLLLASGLALWFCDGVRRRSLCIQSSPPLWGVLTLLAAFYLSTLQAVDLGEALLEMIKWGQVALVLLVVPTMLTPPRAKWLVATLILGAVGQALLGVYQFVFRIGPDWFIILGGFMRASGSFGQPNPFAGYLGVTLPVALSLLLWAIGELWRQPGRTASIWLGYTLAATGLISAGMLASWSRGGWLGAAVGCAAVIFLRSRRALIAGIAAGLVGLIGGLIGTFTPQLIPPSISQRLMGLPAFFGLGDVLNQPVTDENFSIIERVAHWVAAIRMWERSPWLGVGPGNYAVVYPEVHLPRWQEALGHAHNIYLNVLGESGLIGLIAFCLCWLIIIGWLAQQLYRAHQQKARWFAALIIGVIGVLLHLSLHNFFDNLFVQGIQIHVALWLVSIQASGFLSNNRGQH